MTTEFKQIGMRIKGLREACDITREELAAELGVTVDTYTSYEETGADVPISAIFHIASRFGVDLTEILTGTAAKLDTYQVVKAGAGRIVDRYPGYYYQDLAWGFTHKIMQPLLVTLDPSDEPAELVTHTGQEFNLVLSGTVVVTYDGKEIPLEPGDSIYFNPAHPHGQRCGSDVPAQFVTVIAE
ncbi:MAG: helix-turn-helix transcriptional regulator [Coriobacteriia bacterium]|nr:helix-turn-helix transcriptional regulator [Coriobacteriia bacterium]